MIKVVLVDYCTVEDVKCDHLRRIKVTILNKFFFYKPSRMNDY